MNHLYIKTKKGRARSTDKLDDSVLKSDKNFSPLFPGNKHKETRMRWRRVEEELPRRNELVLVCFKSGYGDSLMRTIAYRTYHHERHCWSTDLIYDEPQWYAEDDIDVTHWMPLPEAPLT